MSLLNDDVARVAAQCYADASAPPTFQCANLLCGDDSLTPSGVVVQASQPDLRAGVSRKWCQTLPLTSAPADVATSPPFPVPADAIVSVSPTGDRMLIITNPTASAAGDGANKAAAVELWGRHGFIKTLIANDDPLEMAPHGRVHAPDSTFGCIEWSPDGRVLFCAETRVVVTPITTMWGRPQASKAGTSVDEVHQLC